MDQTVVEDHVEDIVEDHAVIEEEVTEVTNVAVIVDVDEDEVDPAVAEATEEGQEDVEKNLLVVEDVIDQIFHQIQAIGRIK